MNYNWEWSNKIQGEICSPVDAHGYRFMLYVDPAGNYKVIKFLVRNSLNLSYQASRPHMIVSGWCETVDLAKEHAIAAFERFITPEPSEPKAQLKTAAGEAEEQTEEKAEELPVEVEAIAEEPKLELIPEEPEAEPAIFGIQSEPAEDGQIKVWLTGLKENARYKYTTNGKAVIANSKNYKDPFFVAPGTVINAREAVIDENGEEQYNNISKTV